MRTALATVFLFCVGCFGGAKPPPDSSATPVEYCDMSVAAICQRDYACYTAQELADAGWPADEAGCVTMFEAQSSCSARTEANTCTGSNEVFHGDRVDDCIAQIDGLECADIRDPNFDINRAAPACGDVCAVQ